MKKDSLSEIENYYKEKGHRGEELREVLENDEKYQDLLRQRKSKLKTDYDISSKEAEKYVLSIDKDFEILNKCNNLESLDLEKKDKEIVQLIKSQLKHDWRKPLSEKLEELLEKYENLK
ncbi:MAG: hypothetical protein ACOC5T_06950 [Elusimicrobiota bacterium]